MPQNQSLVQKRLNELHDFVTINQMEISIKKTFIQPFCFSRRFNFTPELFYDGKQLDVVYTAKLLGVHFSSDLRWNTHISEMSKKANSKLFFIRRLKDLRASQSTLVENYKLFIRQGLEFASPLWTSSHSKKNIKDLEKLQASLKIKNLCT